MQQKTLFQERQRFNQWWVWPIHLLNIGMVIFFAIGAYVQIIKGQTVGSKPAPDSVLVIATIIALLLCLLFFSMQLKTAVTKDKIHFRFTPFHRKEQEYLLSDIQKMEVVKYSPIGEYGGWGIRGFGNDRAFNVKGNMGLKIYFKNGKKRLIGTQKPDELQKIIKELGF
ncbi:MAG: hypothetical protein WCY89_07495 [Flavobacteriaceae bacterium]